MRTVNLDLPADVAVLRLVGDSLYSATAARARMANSQDAAALHDLRVSLRRLRVCLRAYRPYVANVISDRIVRRVRVLARATSAARDAEVQLAWLESLGRKGQRAEQPGRRWLQVYLTSERKMAYRKIRRDVLPEFDELVRRLRLVLDSGTTSVHKPARCRTLFAEAAGRCMRKYVVVLSEDLSRIGSVGDDAEVHAARIAAKRLRYLVEPLVRREKRDSLLKPLKALQAHMGDLHDRHVLAQVLVWGIKSGATRAESVDLLPGLRAIALRNRQEADSLYEIITRRYLGSRVPVLCKPLRELARQLAAHGVHSASRALGYRQR